MEKVITHFGVFLIFFMNIKCQWGKTCVQVHVFHDGPVTRAYFSTYNSTYEQFFKHVKVVIYKFCIRSEYARIRFNNVSYGEAARGVLSAQNFPTYESV